MFSEEVDERVRAIESYGVENYRNYHRARTYKEQALTELIDCADSDALSKALGMSKEEVEGIIKRIKS